MAAPRSLGWSTVIISVCMVGLSSLPVRAAQVSTSSCASRPFDKVCHPHVPSRLESTDVEIQTWPKNVNTGFMERVYSGYVPSSGRLYRGNYAKVDDPSAFSFQMLPNGCAQRHNVSFSATELGCTYATNAGFFNMTGTNCNGNIILRGSILQNPSTFTGVNFGLTKNNLTVVGFIDPPDLPSFHFQTLVSGVGFLVREGHTYVNQSRDLNVNSSFVTEKAPRSSVGTFKNGSVFLFQTYGIESVGEGLDLHEFASVLVNDIGAWNVMNLDGGGSSTSVYKGQVISRPTCVDTPFPVCERNVTTISCMSVPGVWQ